MRALLFRHDIVRYLLSRGVYAWGRRWWSVRLAPLQLADLPVPRADRSGWVRLRVRMAGICGSDFGAVAGSESLYFEPEATYPFVPGHELVGEVDEAGDGVQDARGNVLKSGDRVAVWPMIGCRAQGLEPLCEACASGWEGLCSRRGAAWPGRGMAIGFNRETGGGWAECCLAHASQLWRLPDGVADEEALGLEPGSVALGALLRSASPGQDSTLVIGGGTIAMQIGLLHRALGLPGTCRLLVRYPYQRHWAAENGIDALSLDGDRSFRAWAVGSGFRHRKIRAYGEVIEGPYDRVIVVAGSEQALRWGLACVRPGGTLALVASPPRIRFDFSRIWHRELTIRGVFVYAPVPWEGEERHPFDVLLPALSDGRLSFGGLVTHRFTLDRYPEAFDTLHRRSATRAMKVAFTPNAP